MKPEEEKWILKVNEILKFKMKKCIDERNEEELPPLLKVKYDTYKEIYDTINAIKNNQ